MQKPHILLVEDNDSVREVVTRQLEALGVSVTALSDGDNVKAELSEKKYALVIADLHLPNCSGFDIARFANAKNCKIVLLSGDAKALSRDDFLTAQFDEVLVKPVTLENLKNLLIRQKIIDQHPGIANTNTFSSLDASGAIDLSVVEEQMGHLDEVALDMLSRFPDMMRPLISRLSERAESGDAQTVLEIAHSLKGAARSAGAVILGKIAEDIQSKAASNFVEMTAIQNLRDEFDRVEIAIRHLCAQKEAAVS